MSRVFQAAKNAVATVNGSSTTVEESKKGLIASKAAQAAQLFEMKVAAAYRSEAAAERAAQKHNWAIAKRNAAKAEELEAILETEDESAKKKFLAGFIREFGAQSACRTKQVLDHSLVEAELLLEEWETAQIPVVASVK